MLEMEERTLESSRLPIMGGIQTKNAMEGFKLQIGDY